MAGMRCKLLFYFDADRVTGVFQLRAWRRGVFAIAEMIRRTIIATTDPSPAMNMSSCESHMSPCMPTNSSPRSGVRIDRHERPPAFRKSR